MLVRLALESDADAVLDMGAANVAETCPGEEFEYEIARRTFQTYLNTSNPTIFVAEKNRELVGFLQAGWFTHLHRTGLFTVQQVLYVSPENRGTRAAVKLTKELIRWSAQLGADHIEGGNDNGFNSERTAGFLSHFGFEKVGYAMRLRLDGHSDERRQKE